MMTRQDVIELAVACQEVDDHEYGRDELDGVDPTSSYHAAKARVAELGHKANDLGGFEMMSALAYAAAQRYRNTLNTVGVHWHRIGEWLH